MSILKGGEDILSKPDDDTYNSAFLGADLELDGSRRNREISLYKNDEVVLTVEQGITLGLLKLIYSSDRKFHGILQGVRSRSISEQPSVTSVILSDHRVLDQDEYELIVQDQHSQSSIMHQTLPSELPPSSTAIPLPPPTNNIFLTNNTEKKMGQFVCEYCHLPFVSKAKFLRHRRIHTEENPYVCVYCSEAFPHHLELRKHREEFHMTNKSFKCNYCPKTFATRAELRGHLWRHTGEKNHKCRICGKSFATKGNLKLHIDKHIGVHKHKCPFCPQRFTSHSSLEAHMAKHTGMKSYKCRHCSKSYAQAGQLTSHERLHTGEKPFMCEVCGKCFRLNSTRQAHEKRHSGSRPHICDTCGRSFSMPDHLRRHLKTHENKLDRLASCPFCKKKIFSGRNMRKHLVRHRELNLTDAQAKAISASLKPDKEAASKETEEGLSTPNKIRQSIHCMECNEEVKSIRKLFEHLTENHYHRELSALERKEIRLQYGLQRLHHCQFCSSCFVDYRLLRSHVLDEHPEHAEDVGFLPKGKRAADSGSQKCPTCSMHFQLRSTLDEHIIKAHLTVTEAPSENTTSSPLFRCWYCVQTFGTTEEVVSHMTCEHESLEVLSKRVELTENVGDNAVSSSGVWSCSQCPATLQSEEEYQAHMAIHAESEKRAASSLIPSTSYLDKLNLLQHEESEANVQCVVKKYLKADYPSVSDSGSNNSTMEISKGPMSSNLPDEVEPASGSSDKKIQSIDNSASTNQENANLACKNNNAEFLPNENRDKSHTTCSSDAISSKSSSVEVMMSPNISVRTTDSDANVNTITNSQQIALSTSTLDEENEKGKKHKKKKKKNKKKNRPLKNDRVFSPLMIYDSIKATDSDGAIVPFRCWFCSVTYNRPEDVVAHMTSTHDNLENLSRRVEVTELKNQLTEKQKVGLKLFKNSTDASLSPVDSFRCSKCPKKLESKEAYELHMIMHKASQDMNLLKTGSLLFNKNKGAERSNSGSIEDEPLPGDQMYSGGNNFNCLAGADNFDFNKSKLMLPSSTIVSPQEASKEVSSVSKPETVEAVATTKTKTNDFKPKLIKKPPSKKVNQSKRKTIVGEGGVGVNMCTHCSRVFCSKRALDVHTFKMHGREYMQNPSHSWNTSPFTCWFCSAQFPSPELVVEHMTKSHENLDKLSKRVEEQNIQANAAIIQDKIPALKPGQSASKRYVSIASSKQMLPLPSLNTTQTAPKSSTNQQPPPGFKMSYALAYVPIFIPEKNESEENRD